MTTMEHIDSWLARRIKREPGPPKPTTVIVNARVVDGTGHPPVSNRSIVIQDGRLSGIGLTSDVNIPGGADVIDAAGNTVMPGIIDCHMHLTPIIDPPTDPRIHLRLGYAAISMLRECLAWGTTTVVSITGGPPAVELRAAIEKGLVDRCSRQLVAGVVNATAGHVRGVAADGPWAVRRAVRELVAEGVDLFKTAASGGFQWEHERVEWPDYTEEELAALVDEAHGKDKPIAVHAHSQPGLSYAIQAGCDMIHHGALIDQKALEGIANRGLFYVPTLFITSRERVDREKQPWTKERMEHAHPIHRQGVRKAHEMGVKIAVGTDGKAGDANIELAELVDCGLSPMEAIVAGTQGSADALGILDRTGTLEPGKIADLLIVNGEPDRDIRVLLDRHRIRLVMRDGIVGKALDEYIPKLPSVT